MSSISGVSGNDFFGGVSALNQLVGAGGTAQSGASDAASAIASSAGGDPSMSKAAQFMSKLQSMEQSNPAQAKQLLSELASKFRSEAAQPGSASAAKGQLADMLQKAADTGDLSALKSAVQNGGGEGATRGAAAYAHTMAVTKASW
jgi:hypothetical protein